MTLFPSHLDDGQGTSRLVVAYARLNAILSLNPSKVKLGGFFKAYLEYNAARRECTNPDTLAKYPSLENPNMPIEIRRFQVGDNVTVIDPEDPCYLTTGVVTSQLTNMLGARVFGVRLEKAFDARQPTLLFIPSQLRRVSSHG